jgi:hypothetical protein
VSGGPSSHIGSRTGRSCKGESSASLATGQSSSACQGAWRQGSLSGGAWRSSAFVARLQDSTRVWTEQPLSGTGKAPPGARICATRPAWPTQSPAIGQLANDVLSLHDAQHAQRAQLRPDYPSKAKSHPHTWLSTARRVKPFGQMDKSVSSGKPTSA